MKAWGYRMLGMHMIFAYVAQLNVTARAQSAQVTVTFQDVTSTPEKICNMS